MANAEENIPTLTQVVNSGDETMLNHFDGEISDEEAKSASTVENASEFENIEVEDIPSLELDDHHSTSYADLGLDDIDLIGQNISDKSTPEITPVETSASKNKQIDTEELKQKIDEAIDEAMPGIQAQIRGKLYAKFGL